MRTIITHPNFDYIGEQIVNNNKDKIIKANINFGNFKDQTPEIFIENVKELIEHKEVTYIGDFSKTQDLFSNYVTISSLLDYYANKVRVIMPYFPVGTMERIDTKGQVATAKYFADIMSSLAPGREGKTSLHIFDIHALQERFYFDNKTLNTEIHTAMSLLKNEIEGKTIVFPDEGAKKRFGNDFPLNEKIFFSKQRAGNKRELVLQEGKAKGKNILIVDDLIQSGGTIGKAAEILRQKGALSVNAFATHGVFPEQSEILLADSLDKLIITDSIPENISRAKNINNMEILSIRGQIEKIIFGD